MKILVTGGAGYVGAVLTAALLERGYEVKVVDLLLWGRDHLAEGVEVIRGDVSKFDPAWLDGIDSVIHLAGLSNDPMADFSPALNFIYNAAGAAIMAFACKKAGIRRFILASSCSVYGYTAGVEMNEETAICPSFPYAISKLMAERAVTCLAGDDFWPIILRKGTINGWSPRMRYDLVVNTMVKSALTQGKIVVSNPSLWRPLIDVQDVAQAYIRALDTPEGTTGVFNIAYDNFTIGRLADEIAARLRNHWKISVPVEIHRRRDSRNYRVSWQKAYEILDFRAKISIGESVDNIMTHVTELHECNDFDNPRYTNVEWFKLKLAEVMT